MSNDRSTASLIRELSKREYPGVIRVSQKYEAIRKALKSEYGIGTSFNYIKKIILGTGKKAAQGQDTGPEITITPTGDGIAAAGTGFKTRPKDVAEVFKFFGIDPDIYDLDGEWNVKEWSTPMKLRRYDEKGNRLSDKPHVVKNYGVQAKFVKKLISDAATFEALRVQLTENGWKPPRLPKVPDRKYNEVIAVMNLFDAHLDKTFVGDLNVGDNSLRSNIERYRQLFLSLLYRVAEFKPKRIILPVGNDLFHTNAFDGQTKKGTQIQYLCDPQFAYERICMTIMETISYARDVAPVTILMVRGNHDQDKVSQLGFWIDMVYGKDRRVTVDRGRNPRKYVHYGNNLLGFDHGDKVKNKVAMVPSWMMGEQPQEFAATKYRKFYCGDIHHQSEFTFQHTKDMPGVEVSFLRSASLPDLWHVEEGYIGIPITVYGDIWHITDGLIEQIRRNDPGRSYANLAISV